MCYPLADRYDVYEIRSFLTGLVLIRRWRLQRWKGVERIQMDIEAKGQRLSMDSLIEFRAAKCVEWEMKYATFNNQKLVDIAATNRPAKKKPSEVGAKGKRKATEDQLDWERVYRDYQNFSKPRGYRAKLPGTKAKKWPIKFEAFWNSRTDLQAFNIEVASSNMDAARKRIENRS